MSTTLHYLLPCNTHNHCIVTVAKSDDQPENLKLSSVLVNNLHFQGQLKCYQMLLYEIVPPKIILLSLTSNVI